jgi:hypothetical protein
MNGLDAHYSALWVENERRQAEGKPTAKYTITVAVEGFVEIDVEATSHANAVDQAMAQLDDRDWDIVVTEKTVADVEKWK